MVQENENGKKIEVSLSKEQLSRLEDYAERKDTSVNSVVRDSIDGHLDWCDTKKIISDACEEGSLRENSKVCQHLEKQARRQ